MRNFFLVLSLFFIVETAEAQLFSRERILNNENFDKARWSWGYFLGFNSYDFKFDYINETGRKDIEVQPGGGFNVGLVGNLRINDYLDLRLEPGLYYTERNLIYPDFEEEADFLREVKSTYIHFPLLLKISTKRLNNFKPFVVAGLSTSINLTGDETNPEDNSVGRFRMTNNTYYYELGFGIDFYLFYFKFTPSIRGVFALTDELVRDFSPTSPYTSNIEKMATRGVFINFTFQ
jgi:hypothetical protein